MNSHTLREDEVYRRAEKGIREGDVDRLHETLADVITERLRRAIADNDNEAVGKLINAIVWDAYAADAESDMDDEQWEPTYVGED